MKRLYILYIILIVISVQGMAQCYQQMRQAGIDALNNGNKNDAKSYFITAQSCPDKPKDNDLASWIKRCNPVEPSKPQPYKEVIVVKQPGEDYDFMGKYPEDDSLGLAVVRLRGKYGFIDNQSNEIIPLKYDDVESNKTRYGWGSDRYSSRFAKVSQNNKWGLINIKGEQVIPMEYDDISTSIYNFSKDKDTLLWAKKDNKYGWLDLEGNIVIPFEYDDMERGFYNGHPAYAKKNGKYGFIDQKNNVIIPFKYDTTTGFGYYTSLAPVSINGKYGFVNLQGEEVIPLQYEFASKFEYDDGLAPVVKGNKVGFVNSNGDLIVPCQYEVEYDYEYESKKKTLGRAVYVGPISIVKKGEKYGLLNKQGKEITAFKYDRWHERSNSGDVIMGFGNELVYLDKGGNEYASAEERFKLSPLKLAEQGDVDSQYRVGVNCFKEKDYENAFPWIEKAAKQHHVSALDYLGFMYYYGYGTKKSLVLACGYFIMSAEKGNDHAQYYLGWMYEHGDYVYKNIDEALAWYKKSAKQGYKPAKDRLAQLGYSED